MGNTCSHNNITFFKQCSICQKNIIYDSTTPFKCKHSLHIICNKHFYNNKVVYKCPLCRSDPLLQYPNVNIDLNSKDLLTPSKYLRFWKPKSCIKYHKISIKKEYNKVYIVCSCNLKKVFNWFG